MRDSNFEDIWSDMLSIIVSDRKSQEFPLAKNSLSLYGDVVRSYLNFCVRNSIDYKLAESAREYLGNMIRKKRNASYIQTSRNLLRKMLNLSIVDLPKPRIA